MEKIAVTCLCILLGLNTNNTTPGNDNSSHHEEQLSISTSCDITAEAGEDVLLCNGLPGQLGGSITGNFTSFEWSPSIGLSSTTILNPVVNVSTETVYTLTVMGIGDNLIENGDFETGDISPATSTLGYVGPGAFPNGNNIYTVGNSGSIVFLPTICNGNMGPEMMVTNGAGNDIWCQGIPVDPNTDYKLEVWVGGVDILFLASSAPVDIKINGVVLGTISGSSFCDWNLFKIVWNSGPNSFADICLNTGGDDDSYALIDGISFVECCLIDDEVTVRVEEVEAQILPADTITCENHPLILNGTLSTQGNGVTYEWTTSDGLILAGDNTTTPEIDRPGTYVLRVTGPLGCWKEESIQIVGNVDPPEVGFIGANLDCLHDSAIIYIDTMFLPNLSFEWKGPNGYTSKQQQDTVTEPGKYFVIVRDKYRCEVEDTIFVKDLRTQAEFTIDIDSMNCMNDSAVISLNFQDSLATILWDGPNGFTSDARSIIVGEGGSYYLTILDSLDCPYLDTVMVEDTRVFPNIIIAADTITCKQPFSNLLGQSDSTNVSFHWTGPNGFDDTNSSTTTTDTGWHYLEVMIAGGCSSFDSIFVAVDGEIPTLDIMGDTLTCINDEIILRAVTNDINVTADWIGPNNISSDRLTLTVRDSGNYILTIENAQGCQVTKSFYVISDMDEPNDSISGNSIINCKDEMVNLSANDTLSGIQQIWTFKNNNISNANSIAVNNAGWYYLSKIGKNGCIGIDSIEVTVDTTKPNFSLDADIINCLNSNPQVLINNNDVDGGWLWYNETTMTYSRPDTSLDVTKPGWYKVRVFKSNFCATIDSIEVGIDTISPIVLVRDDSLTCAISSLNLKVSVLNSYKSVVWTGPNGFSSNLLQPQIDEAGTYHVIVTADNGCVSEADINITQEGTLPNIDAISDTLNCNRTSVTLQGSSNTPGVQFVWAGPNGFNSNMANPSVIDSGWYELTVIGEGGCKAIKRIYVGLDDEIPIENWEVDTLTCIKTFVDIKSIGASGSYSYLWNGPNGFGATDQNITVNNSGVYNIVFTGQNGCDNSINITVEEDIQIPNINTLNDTLDCRTGSVVLDFTTTTVDYTFAWIGPKGYQSTDKNPSVTEEGQYTISINNNKNGCSNEQILNVLPPNTIDAFHTETKGDCNDNMVELIVDQITGGTGPYSYSFNGGILQSDNTYLGAPGIVEVRVEDAKGCSYTEQVQLDNIEPLDGSLVGEITLTAGEQYQVQTSTNRNIQDIATILWQPSDGLSCNDCLNPTLTASKNKVYQVTITDIFGCEITLEIRVIVKAPSSIYVPNSFTPNGDGINDRFIVFTPDGSTATIKIMQIYSRWGENVFKIENGEANDPLSGWDGQYNSKDVLPGVYVYHAIIQWSTGVEQSVDGSITVVR